MKRLSIIAGICTLLAFAACKGNPSTTSGDSTGTGAVGARVPGKESSDTTRRGPATGADVKDTAKTSRDTSSR
jgi:hypothetical protein